MYLTCIGPDDYTSINTDLIFDACNNLSCIDIVIEEDCLVEREEEQFSVVLDRGVGMVESIRLEPATGYVIIIDSDSKCGISSLSTHSLTPSLIHYTHTHSLSLSLSIYLSLPLSFISFTHSPTAAVIEFPRDVYYATEGDIVILNSNLELLYPLQAELQVRNYYNTHYMVDI